MGEGLEVSAVENMTSEHAAVDTSGLMSPWTARDFAEIYGEDLDGVIRFLGFDWDPDTPLTINEVELLDLAYTHYRS